MTEQRIKEIAVAIYANVRSDAFGSTQTLTEEILKMLPEFQEQKWIKCSEKMPEERVPIYILDDRNRVLPSMLYHSFHIYDHFCIERNHVTHWMPRFVPEAPKMEEESFVDTMTKFINESETPYSKVAYKNAILVYERIHNQKETKNATTGI